MSGQDTSLVEKLKKVGGNVVKLMGIPITEKQMESLSAFFKEDTKGVSDALEKFSQALSRIGDEVALYTEEQRKTSQLALAVKMGLQSVLEWGNLIAQGKPPSDLTTKIQQKTEELDQSIQAEQIRFGRVLQQRVDLTTFFQQLSVKSPMDYYKDGKACTLKKDWVGAKENFLKYQYLVEAKINNKLPESLDKQEFKDPYEDQHCEYLEVCQKKLMTN